MSQQDSYWARGLVSRRTALRGAAALGGGAVALSLAGCGSDDEGGGGSSPATSTASQELDWTKGKPGGTLNIQTNGYPAGLDFIERGGHRSTYFSYSGLLGFKAGKSGIDPTSLEIEPDNAQALPEQPNETTYIFKVRPDVKFHNGRALTAQDVKYSLDLYGTDKSALKDGFNWIDKVEATDAQTVTVRAKVPYADGLLKLVAYGSAFLFAKEYQESREVNEKMMGTGPFIHTGSQSPVSLSFRKNPDYFQKPLPYFDNINFQVITDTARQVGDFLSRQLHFTWYYFPEKRDEVKRGRPEARMTEYENFGQVVYMRTDQAPFTDKRVRQALGMSIDRKQLRDGVANGEGQDDQTLSISQKYWGFRRPAELRSAKNWNFDPAAAKQLLSAAGASLPLDRSMTIATQAGNTQTFDQGTLIHAKWRDLGIANLKVVGSPTAQFQTSVGIGQYDDFAMFNNSQEAVAGTWHRNRLWSPPEGVKTPTPNLCHVNNADVSRLVDKQLTQFKLEDRKTTFKELEEILAEEQFSLVLNTAKQAWFLDPSVKNSEVFSYSSNGYLSYTKYWWFEA